MASMITRSATLYLTTLGLLLSAPGVSAQEGGSEWHFDGDAVGRLPVGWTVGETQPSVAPAHWEVLADPAAPSAPQVFGVSETHNEDRTFNLAIADDTSFTDLDLSVQVKAIGGRVDQGGGPIWRCRDENNYYIARFNPLESNFRVYRVKDGHRHQLDSATIETQPGKWYQVEVRMVGTHITCAIDGRPLLETDDSSFTGPGKIGLWTKSDAVTRFDDLIAGEIPSRSASRLERVRALPMDDVRGRIDHLAFDPTGQRLFVAALGNGSLEEIDLALGKRGRRALSLAEPQGILYLSRRDWVVTSWGKDGSVHLYDVAPGKPSLVALGSIELGSDADNMRFDPLHQRIWVAHGEGALSALGIDGEGGLVSGVRIPLDGHPESFQLNAAATRAWVNVPDAGQVAALDLESGRVISKWPLGELHANYPMALDEAGGRLFIGCRRPARLVVMDTQSGRRLASVECVGDADDIFYDAPRHRLFVIGGEGFVDIFSVVEGSAPRRIERVESAPGARTGLWIPDQARLFVAAPAREGKPARVLEYRLREGG